MEKDEKIKKTGEDFGIRSAKVQELIFDSGFFDSGIIDSKDLVFHDDVRVECEKNRCRGYGRTWACPPAVGTVAECRERVMKYGRMQLFSKAYEMEDTMDFKEIHKDMADFKVYVRDLGKKLRDELPSFILLSNESCGKCSKCTYPDDPCRFPDELYHSIEGYGFNVLELTRQAGMKYINGQKTVTFFGAVIYDEG